MEIGTIRIWHANTYRLENTLNYGFERAWALSYMRGGNFLGFGFDDGVVVIKVSLAAYFPIQNVLTVSSLAAKSHRSVWTKVAKSFGRDTMKS